MITIILVGLIFGSYLVEKDYLKKYFLFATITLSVLSFFIIPIPRSDLLTYNIWLDIFKHTNNISQVFTYNYFRGQSIWGIYLFFISKLQYKGFLPAISVFLTYKTLLNLLFKVSINHNARKKDILFGFTFLMLTISYGGIVHGIRNMLAFSILAKILYTDIIENKNRKQCFIIYLILTQLHSSVFIFLFLRILLVFKNKYTSIIINLSLMLWSILILPIVIKVLAFSRISIFLTLNEKISVYMNSGITSQRSMYSKAILLFIILFAFIIIKKEYKKCGFSEYNKYMSLVLLFTIGSFQQYDLFVRSINLIVLLLLFYIVNVTSIYRFENNMETIVGREKNKYRNIILMKGLLISSALLLFYMDYIILQRHIFFEF